MPPLTVGNIGDFYNILQAMDKVWLFKMFVKAAPKEEAPENSLLYGKLARVMNDVAMRVR